ncbi:callose synthase 10-like [Bidens hawaiensis]|uniref:callose synthase 10-like n=1 Tax=Bidens hawaiensis TaxID=980011 RepID=UPI00404BA23A
MSSAICTPIDVLPPVKSLLLPDIRPIDTIRVPSYDDEILYGLKLDDKKLNLVVNKGVIETQKVLSLVDTGIRMMGGGFCDSGAIGIRSSVSEPCGDEWDDDDGDGELKKTNQGFAGDLTPYNIVPLDVPSSTNAVGFYQEVRAAITALKYHEQYPRLPADFVVPAQRNLDIFDLLEFVFGFQKDNIRNQRENVVLALANAQSRLGIPVGPEPQINERAITEVFMKVLDNYIKWCKYLRVRLVWNRLQAINKDSKLFLVSLYFLIWGEAANVRFLPECICYIFHHMARELDATLDNGEALPAGSCTGESNKVSFLDQVIQPIYNALSKEAARNYNGKAAHSAWRNYDDFNEYFWSPACFELSWPMRPNSPFLREPVGRNRTGKSTFVERRTFLHLYRSFHRLWIFLIVMFQGLTIIAYNDGKLNVNTFKTLLSIGPTYAILKFVNCCLDVLLMFGAYSTARGMAISRLVIRVGHDWSGPKYLIMVYEIKRLYGSWH